MIVTDPGSPLDQQSRADGFRVVNADPDVGGRYSALTAFGLVPSGLAGADIGRLLDEAESVSDLLATDDEANPGLRLGAAIAATSPLRNKLVLVDQGSGLTGFADWAEQLIAESTGKQGTGLLPVVVADDSAPEVALPPHDVTVVHLADDTAAEPHVDPDEDVAGSAGSDIVVSGTLGAQMLLWEVATATAGRLLGINPFDQPDVESAKKAARSMLEGEPDSSAAELHRRRRRGPRARRGLARRRRHAARGGRGAARPGRRPAGLPRGDGLPRPAASRPTWPRCAAPWRTGCAAR